VEAKTIKPLLDCRLLRLKRWNLCAAFLLQLWRKIYDNPVITTGTTGLDSDSVFLVRNGLIVLALTANLAEFLLLVIARFVYLFIVVTRMMEPHVFEGEILCFLKNAGKLRVARSGGASK